MVLQQEPASLTFAGTAEEQAMAARVFELVRTRGRFMSVDASIRVSVDSIVEFLIQDGTPATAEGIEAAVAANPAIFAIDEVESGRLVTTTRSGRSPRERVESTVHTFVRRFMTPLPKPERPEQPVRERARIDPSWATLSTILGDLGVEEDELPGRTSVDEPLTVVEAVVPIERPVEAVPEPQPEPVVPRTITVPAAVPAGVGGMTDFDLAAAIAERLRSDIRVANFGDGWMAEDRVPRFSRGDLRRMKEYIQEQEQPLTDDVLVQDVLAVRPTAADFALMRFAVNFRLSREHREFDFVGTNSQRFWSTSALPPIGTTRRKPNEIGTDYRFLQDELPEQPPYRSLKSIDHVLTLYEYHLGLLPYDTEMQALLPAPLLPNQRSAVLTFECPQSYTTYLVELRYPTPNRGGFIVGLDDFYSENLVPGALVSISQTENDGHYTVEYIQTGNQSARLLEIDERRARYVFRPTTFSCGIVEEMLLSEERFPRLATEKPLDDKVRRRPEAVVAAIFERIGQVSDGHGYWATFNDLFAAVNIERPFSSRLLRAILETDETGAFAHDPDGTDAYTYVPGTPSS